MYYTTCISVIPYFGFLAAETEAHSNFHTSSSFLIPMYTALYPRLYKYYTDKKVYIFLSMSCFHVFTKCISSWNKILASTHCLTLQVTLVLLNEGFKFT